MTYTAAAGVGVLVAAALDLFVFRVALLRRVVFWATYPIIFAFQLISNGILTGRDIVMYDPDAIIGWRLVHAPIEDLLFGFAMVVFALDLWVFWGRRLSD